MKGLIDRQARTTWFATIGVAFVFAACGGSAPATSPAATSPATLPESSTPVASSLPTDEATPSPASSTLATSDPSPLCATDQRPCDLKAGTYTTEPFDAAFTFEIGGGWSSERVFAHGGAISKGEAAFFWASEVRGGTVDGARVPIGPEPDDFLAHLARYEGFTIGEPSQVTIGGVTGRQVDVTTNETDAPGFLAVPEEPLNFDAGEKLRFFVLDKEGKTVILIVDAWHEAEFEAFVDETTPLIESITWE